MTGIESIKDGFAYPIINKFPGRPNYDTIAEVHTKLKANAASVHSNLGTPGLSTTARYVYSTHWSSI